MKVITLSFSQATTRLAELKHELDVALNWKERLEELLADLLKRLHDDLPKRGRSYDQQRQAEALSAAIQDVKQGVAVREGVSEHIWLDISGKAGLDTISERIPMLRKDIRLLRRHLTRWPSESVTHPYRFKGSAGLTHLDGRELEPGDVVNLTRAQAGGWRERFEEIEESAAQKAS